MSYIGVINTDEKLEGDISRLLDENGIKNSKFLSDEDEILDFISFELPELIIINFSDRNVDLCRLLLRIREDPWLNSFGILGLYDHEKVKEEDLLTRFQDYNILSLLDFIRIKSSLIKCINIILENKQIVFNKDLSEKLFDKDVGSFEIENDPLAVSVYAGIASSILVLRGFIKPDSRIHLQLVLAELMINGIEHGNCGISFDEKTEFLDKGGNIVDLIEEKNRDYSVARKRVRFEWDISKDSSKFIIRDEGSGFDIFSLKEKVENEGPYALHGRGIRMASMFAKRIAYNRAGNAVLVEIEHDKDAKRKAPEGFSNEEVIYLKKGDIVCKEGDSGDALFYISSGRFSVWHRDSRVGNLDPSDIFMGEMSFFLNNERSATVVAESDAIIVKVPRKNFIQIIKQYPQYGLFLAKLLSRKLARANTKSAELQAVSNI